MPLTTTGSGPSIRGADALYLDAAPLERSLQAVGTGQMKGADGDEFYAGALDHPRDGFGPGFVALDHDHAVEGGEFLPQVINDCPLDPGLIALHPGIDKRIYCLWTAIEIPKRTLQQLKLDRGWQISKEMQLLSHGLEAADGFAGGRGLAQQQRLDPAGGIVSAMNQQFVRERHG